MNLKRIQRKRTKGFKLPPNTVCVNRGTKWGNPIKLEGDMIYINASYRRKLFDPWVFVCCGEIKHVIDMYSQLWNTTNQIHGDFRHWAKEFKKLDLSELKGKNLACFCPEG
jgi:hypothetical protein